MNAKNKKTSLETIAAANAAWDNLAHHQRYGLFDYSSYSDTEPPHVVRAPVSDEIVFRSDSAEAARTEYDRLSALHRAQFIADALSVAGLTIVTTDAPLDRKEVLQAAESRMFLDETDRIDHRGAAPGEPHQYLLMKRGVFYGPRSEGYTSLQHMAGLFTESQVARYRRQPELEVTVVHRDDAPIVAPGAHQAIALEHLERTLDAVIDGHLETSAKLQAERIVTHGGFSCTPSEIAVIGHMVSSLEAAYQSNRTYAFEVLEVFRDYLEGATDPESVIKCLHKDWPEAFPGLNEQISDEGPQL